MSTAANVRKATNQFRESLFYLPALFVIGSVVAAQTMLVVDRRVDIEALPTFLRFTVDSAREVLGTIAGATITVAGIVFALTALTVQLASSQFSPRVVRGFLRDRFQQTAIGFMVGTFTYSLLILRAVRTPDGNVDNVVPNLSAGLALVFAIVAVLTILGYVNHTAHSLQASTLIGRVTDETVGLIRKRFPEPEADQPPPRAAPHRVGAGCRVVATSTGWVQQVTEQALTESLPPGAVIRVDVGVGAFVYRGGRLCTVWSPSVDDDLERCINEAFVLGSTRTMQEDVAFGIRQLVDIALRALSTGVNDATTAYECIVHLGAVLNEILRRDLPDTVGVDDDQRWVLRPEEPTYDGYAERAFDQIRLNAVVSPHLSSGMIGTMSALVLEAEERGQADRTTELRRQIRLVVEGVAAADPLPADLERVRRAAAPVLGGEVERSVS